MKAIVFSVALAMLSMGASMTVFADDYAEHQAQLQAKVSYEQAKAKALQVVGGGTVVDVDFDLKRGNSYYSVEVVYNHVEYEIKIDASTGAVLSKKIDY